jgi:hypothetical protein
MTAAFFRRELIAHLSISPVTVDDFPRFFKWNPPSEANLIAFPSDRTLR